MPSTGTHGDARRAERTVRQRRAATEMQHGAAHQQEREQCPDADHLAEQSDREARRDQRQDDADQRLAGKRRLEPRMHSAEEIRQQPVLCHRKQDPRLSEQQDEDHRRQPGKGCEFHQNGQPPDPGDIDRDRHRIGNTKALVRHHAGHHECHQDVEDGADDQRAQDPDRHILLRSSRLLCGGRDGVEADIGKEHHRRTAQNAAPAELAEGAGVRRDEGDPVRAGSRRSRRR